MSSLSFLASASALAEKLDHELEEEKEYHVLFSRVHMLSTGTFCPNFSPETEESEGGDSISTSILRLVDHAVGALQKLGASCRGCLRQSARCRTLGENHFPGEI